MTGAVHADVEIWITPAFIALIVDYFPYSEGCTVGSQFNGSADTRFDGEGNQVVVTKVE